MYIILYANLMGVYEAFQNCTKVFVYLVHLASNVLVFTLLSRIVAQGVYFFRATFTQTQWPG